MAEFREAHGGNPFPRIPVYGEQPDQITGFVLRADILTADDPDQMLSEMVREIPVEVDSMPVSSLYERLISNRDHFALVVNEFGDFEGIATLEDVIETLLGDEIVDELDSIADMRAAARQQLEESGLTLPATDDPSQPAESG